jgi:hypothetical protein
MRITYLYLGLPWESMEGWKATQGKFCIFKRAMGLQTSKEVKIPMCSWPKGKLQQGLLK